MQLIGTVFQGGGTYGDFGWMIPQPEFSNALFVFNDNQEQFLAHLNDSKSTYGCAPGGGNAIVRPYQCQNPPRAAGIPTGSMGASYSALSPDTALMIDNAVKVIESLLSSGRYNRVFYSATSENGPLGTGIFKVSKEVKDYILEKLRALT